MDTLDLDWTLAATGASARATTRTRPTGWQHVRAALRPRILPTILAALTLLALLLAFQQVVRDAVQQGELRRRAAAAAAHDLWRCNVLGDMAERESCLSRLYPQ